MDTMNPTKAPNPDRIFAVVNTILERRYDVKIEYVLETKVCKEKSPCSAKNLAI